MNPHSFTIRKSYVFSRLHLLPLPLTTLLILFLPGSVKATKLNEVSVIDQHMLNLHFIDGAVKYIDDGIGEYKNSNAHNNDYIESYGNGLNTGNASNNSSYSISSPTDANYSGGSAPTTIYRKTKVNDQSRSGGWSNGDFQYEATLEHWMYLQLPTPLQQGHEYTISINSNTETDVTSYTFTYDIFSTLAHSIKVNIVGYQDNDAIKAADLYMWIGDGGKRDFSAFEGNKVYIYDINAETSTEVGSVNFWKSENGEGNGGNYNLVGTDVWNIDFTGFNTPGDYRLAVEGVGCSDEFKISSDIYFEPMKLATRGMYYMRMGEDENSSTLIPPPRHGHRLEDGYTIEITTLTGSEGIWSGDKWDQPDVWAPYSTGKKNNNPKAFGGHADAHDEDKHSGHMSIPLDLMLPYVITQGAINDDNLDIEESGNGIPDIIDEARNEIDYWLALRDGQGYSPGLTNPDGNKIFYQAANDARSAWKAAAGSAMLSYCFKLSGHPDLMNEYLDSALVAYNFITSKPLSEQDLDDTGKLSIKDFKSIAEVYLYNITGDQTWEDKFNTTASAIITNGTSLIYDEGYGRSPNNTINYLFTVAGYLFSDQTIHYQSLWDNMKASIIYEAKKDEANYINSRPSRRGADNYNWYFQTITFIDRSIIAHAISEDGPDKDLFLNALTLEADWTLGRNPLNIIQMTTWTSPLQSEHSVEEIYYQGEDDGVEGVKPGITPYGGVVDGSSLIQGSPSWFFGYNYPAGDPKDFRKSNQVWPMAECFYDTRYCYFHTEFTPQQTMRGKSALYEYLHSLGSTCEAPNLGNDASLCGVDEVSLNSNLDSQGRTFAWYENGSEISGANSPTYSTSSAGNFKVVSNENGCIQSDQIEVLNILPSIDLGPDLDLCDPSVAVLDPLISGEVYTYDWTMDGKSISDDQVIEVSLAGDYEITVSASGCLDALGHISISSSLLDVSFDTLCEAGTANLIVNGNSTYRWYDQLDEGALLSTEPEFNPTVSNTTTFYVEDAAGFSGSLGLEEFAGTWDNSNSSWYHVFEVQNDLTLEEISVNVVGATELTINLCDENKNVLDSKTFSSLTTGAQQLVLGFDLSAGNYMLGYVPNGTMKITDNSGYAAFPYDLPGYITITGTDPSWLGGSNRDIYGYNWKISAGNSCARTPVLTVIDPLNVGCITGTKTVNNNELLLFPNPTTAECHFTETVKYTVYNTTGQLLDKGQSNHINLSTFNESIFFVHAKGSIYKVIKY
jgi:endoglucanase